MLRSARITVPLVVAALCACAGPPRDQPGPVRAGGVLDAMGIALVDDGTPATPSGSVTATFTAPVAAADGTLAAPGSAHAAFTNPDGSDDGSRDLSAGTIVGAFPDSDVVYAVLFEQDAPWRYVIVAAHAPDLVAGADVSLDGASAAALVVDENTGSGFLSQGGTLHVDAADLSPTGNLTGSFDADLVEVGLSSWPESLFPFTADGSPSTRAAATGSGTFAAVYSASGASAPGSASVSVDVDGYATFTGGPASAEPLDDQDTVIVIADGAGGRRMLAIFVENSALVAGTTVSLAGYSAGAELFEDDGATVAFVDGTLTLDQVSLDEGGAVTGSLSLSGDAYVIPADQGGGDVGGNTGEDCTGLDGLDATFAPATVTIQSAGPNDGFPAGYDRFLTFTDGGDGLLGILLSSDVDLHAGAPYAFSTVDLDGRAYPAAMLGLATCSDAIPVDSGTLTAVLDDAAQTLSGTLDATIGGQDRSWTFAASVVAQ